jgi:hypothetical protein
MELSPNAAQHRICLVDDCCPTATASMASPGRRGYHAYGRNELSLPLNLQPSEHGFTRQASSPTWRGWQPRWKVKQLQWHDMTTVSLVLPYVVPRQGAGTSHPTMNDHHSRGFDWALSCWQRGDFYSLFASVAPKDRAVRSESWAAPFQQWSGSALSRQMMQPAGQIAVPGAGSPPSSPRGARMCHTLC